MDKYTVDYYEKKVKKIPLNIWFEGEYSNLYETKFCILGHCGHDGHNTTEEGRELILLFGHEDIITDINDGNDKRYQQKTPRSRILAALRDIKKG